MTQTEIRLTHIFLNQCVLTICLKHANLSLMYIVSKWFVENTDISSHVSLKSIKYTGRITDDVKQSRDKSSMPFDRICVNMIIAPLKLIKLHVTYTRQQLNPIINNTDAKLLSPVNISHIPIIQTVPSHIHFGLYH